MAGGKTSLSSTRVATTPYDRKQYLTYRQVCSSKPAWPLIRAGRGGAQSSGEGRRRTQCVWHGPSIDLPLDAGANDGGKYCLRCIVRPVVRGGLLAPICPASCLSRLGAS